ncbi:cadherin-like domain-containing protein [Bathymodiolus platifrons methanotrophic gill symbiont]|uniref:cadherin-like domain-containing protein n=1 Tax=Bathymodiolus platifrons methanotrophic gill symbiont TaxID=113268 RepID=UPI0021E15817|nr:cadherin-like domain-containing protein [Bathymodiolus platifrons methanotrophic gill symbiont]
MADPAPGYSGDDSFTYRVNDGNKDSNEATVSIVVHADNHAPVLSPSTHIVSPNTVLQVGINKGVLVNAVDKDKNLIYATLVTGAIHGSVQLLPGGGFIYTPKPGFTGKDKFIVKGTDNRGESLFLRKLVLGIPAQASSKNLTRPLMPPAAPIRPRHLVPTQQGVGT